MFDMMTDEEVDQMWFQAQTREHQAWATLMEATTAFQAVDREWHKRFRKRLAEKGT